MAATLPGVAAERASVLMRVIWSVFAMPEDGDPDIGYTAHYPNGRGDTPKAALAEMVEDAKRQAEARRMIAAMVERVRV